jgi:RNA polymerase sigma-70 factor (ECF subfamily)
MATAQALEPAIALSRAALAPMTDTLPEAPVVAATLDRRVAAARRGDADAFVDLFLASERRLRLLAFGVLRDPDSVDDALQETALRAFRGLGRFRGEAQLATWLHRITVHVCLDMLAQAQRQAGLAQRMRPAQTVAAPPEAALDGQRRLSAALARLSPQQRAVVAVVLQLGFDTESAAAILEIPRGTVASRLHAARQALMAALASQEELECGTTLTS